MISLRASRRSALANAIYGLLNPIPFGCFVAALIFDATYARSGVILWDKGASWLITFGLLFALIPRIIQLVQVWVTGRRTALRVEKVDFWLHLLAIILAIFNALVHTRDAYGVVPAGVWLSLGTVLVLAIGRVMMSLQCRVISGESIHE